MQFGMMDGYGYGYGMMSGGYWIIGLIFWLLVLIGLVLLIKYLWESGGGTRREQESAIELLKKRYARGEISKEEFEEKKKDLL
ncbi:MAG: SHOCT domain-containing protein [Candidatus Methanoperedens sp.]|nr:SHOCT domain-containing protein [Candidatus Methanoperedens sp.]